MIRVSIYVVATTFLTFMTFSFIKATEPDHIEMDIYYQDSVFHVNATYRHTTERRTDSIYFILNPGFVLDTIKSDRLTSYRLAKKAERPFPLWLLTFDQRFDSGRNLTVRFEYSIDLAKQNHLRSDWIELNADRLWFPNRRDLDNEFTYEVAVFNLPSSYTLVTDPNAEVSEKGNRSIIRSQKPTYEILILAGSNMKYQSFDKEISFLANTATKDSILHSMGFKVRNSIDYLNKSFGTSRPIKEFIVVLRNTPEKEIGYQFNRDNLCVTGTGFNNYANLSHEISHYWWSQADFIKEPWMNESFANYSMYKVVEKYDPGEYHRLLEHNRQIAENSIPVSEATLFAENAYPSYYHKGAIHLLKLEERLGEDRMMELLAVCIEKSIATTDEFLKEIEEVSNQRTRDYFAGLMET